MVYDASIVNGIAVQRGYVLVSVEDTNQYIYLPPQYSVVSNIIAQDTVNPLCKGIDVTNILKFLLIYCFK